MKANSTICAFLLAFGFEHGQQRRTAIALLVRVVSWCIRVSTVSSADLAADLTSLEVHRVHVGIG